MSEEYSSYNDRSLEREKGLSASPSTPKTLSMSHTRKSAQTRDAYVIAVANQKGGVAKTTTVVSLGGALAQNGQEVLLVDLDAQANLTLALGKDPSRVRSTITEVLFNNATLLSVSRETDIPGLDLVPASGDMDLAERFLPRRKDYETILKRSMNGSDSHTQTQSASAEKYIPQRLLNRASLSSLYDFVILDCPPFTGAVTLNALTAANMLIIPTQPEYFSAHALKTMMTLIRQVRKKYNPHLTYRVLITMFDKRNRIHRGVSEQIKQAFAKGVFNTQIGVDTKLRESAVEGKPITHFKAKSRSSLQYEELAQEIIDYVQSASTT